MTDPFVVPEALGGERLDRVVAIVADASRAEVTRWISSGRVSIDGTAVTDRSMRVTAGMQLGIDQPERIEQRPRGAPDVRFAVVHSDDDVIVVDKPAGLVVHPGHGHPGGTLVNGLLARYPEVARVGDPQRPGIVHRLDRGTSGLLVVARSERSHRALVDALARHEVRRSYLAVVLGHPESGRGLIDAPIGRSPSHATRMAVVSGGRAARTRYEVLERFTRPRRAALLRFDLETGRTHQIRVHGAAIGHPVLGDSTYGGGTSTVGLARPFLHAAALAFVHPGSGEELSFESELPEDLTAVLATFQG